MVDCVSGETLRASATLREIKLAPFMPGVYRAKGATVLVEVDVPVEPEEAVKIESDYAFIASMGVLSSCATAVEVRQGAGETYFAPAGALGKRDCSWAFNDLLKPLAVAEKSGDRHTLRALIADFRANHRWWFEAFGWPDDFCARRNVGRQPLVGFLLQKKRTEMWFGDTNGVYTASYAEQFPQAKEDFVCAPKGVAIDIYRHGPPGGYRQLELNALFGDGYGDIRVEDADGKLIGVVNASSFADSSQISNVHKSSLNTNTKRSTQLNEEARLETRVLSAPIPNPGHQTHVRLVGTGEKGLAIHRLGFTQLPSRPVREWQVIGPFDKGGGEQDRESYLKAFPPENEPFDANAKYVGMESETVRWKTVTLGPGERILDIAAATPCDVSRCNAVTYLRTTIRAPRKMPTMIRYVNDYYGAIWLNGKPLVAEMRGPIGQYKSAEVWLEKGENEVLVKTSPGSAGTWYFGASVDDCGELAFGGDVTADIQAKIDAAASRGGGEVVVQSGEHRVTSLWLRSGVTLHLARDARLVASMDCSAYPKVEGGHPAGVVNARGMKDVKIIGEPGSCIDGGNCYNPQGGEGYRGPHAIWIVDSTNVVVRGMHIRDAANYAVAFLRCRDTLVEDCIAEGGHDGIHHDVCDGVRISGCRLETGDDSIAGACCTDVVVSNCVLNSACSPIRYGGRDVLITDCRVTGPAKHPHRWTLTKEEKARGARSSEVKGRRTTGCFYQTYTGDRPIMGFRPGNVVIRNVTVENCERFMVSLSGISGAIWQNGVAIPDVTFENVHATGLAKPSVVAAPADSPLRLTFRNCSFGFRSPQKTAFVVSNVKVAESDVSLDGVSGSLAEERRRITYDDIPEFPSWQIEDAATRAIWGLPPLSCGLADMATSHGGACGADPHELTVSPDGMSPQEALLAIRAAKAKGVCGAWTVLVKPGVYTLKETLQFAPCDSGTPDAPVTWVGGGTNTMFAGGEILRDWRNEGGGVWSAPIPRSPSGESAYFEQLWVNGRRADRARLPDSSSDNPVDGYFRIAAASIQAVTNAEGKVTYVEHVTPSNAAALALMPADEMKWAQMCVVHKWAFSRRIIKAVDPATLVVETHSPKDWDGWRQWNPDETLVFFENVRPAFDAPGEWFYDAKSGRVLYRPLPGEDMTKVQAVVPSSKISRLVEFAGDPDNGEYVHDILFKGITFAYSDSTSEDGGHGPTQSYQLQAARGCDGTITARGVRRILFDGCTVAHTGNYGIRFNDGCMSNTVVNCRLFDLGAGGVWMGAGSNYVAKGETLSRRVIENYAPRSTAFNRIENCIMRHGGLFNPEGTGVAFTHVSDSKVLNCDISDFYYTGISVGFTWGYRGSVAQRNEIAFNRIYDLGKGVMSDMGGVYTLGTSFGTRVHHNVVHGVRAYSYGGWGLYADEGSEGVTMDHNVCWDTTDGGFHQHYGVGCVIRDNIFAWNRKLGAVRMQRQVVNGIPSSLHFVGNIVVVREGPLVGDGPRGVGGVWASNLWYDYSGHPVLDGFGWDGWAACGKEVGGVYADPQFENPLRNDFRLKPTSPAFALGFEPWDYNTAGLHHARDREEEKNRSDRECCRLVSGVDRDRQTGEKSL